LLEKNGQPGSPIRPEGNLAWVLFGIISAFCFTLLGCHNWRAMPVQLETSLLIILNILTIQSSALLMHLAFFGRLIALYTRNLIRVQELSELLLIYKDDYTTIDAWWNCRNFVLNEDLALDYDIGGLAVSFMFIVNICVFGMFINLLFNENEKFFQVIIEPPGNYYAFAVLYITLCMYKYLQLLLKHLKNNLSI